MIKYLAVGAATILLLFGMICVEVAAEQLCLPDNPAWPNCLSGGSTTWEPWTDSDLESGVGGGFATPSLSQRLESHMGYSYFNNAR